MNWLEVCAQLDRQRERFVDSVMQSNVRGSLAAQIQRARLYSDLAEALRAGLTDHDAVPADVQGRVKLSPHDAFDAGYRAAMQYAERVAGEPVLLDTAQIERAWQAWLSQAAPDGVLP